MKNSKVFFLFTICLIFTSCGSDWIKLSQESNDGLYEIYQIKNYGLIKLDPSKCYVQCIYPDQYLNDNEEVIKDTGTDYNTLSVTKKNVLISPATTRWEKGKPDPNCQSTNPEDCIVMCLVDVPAVTETHYIVTDTSLNKSFKITDLTEIEQINLDDKSALVEVLCEVQITNTVIESVNQQLINLGYLDKQLIEDTRIFSSQTKATLRSYQEAHGLPIGGALNIPTLEHLGIAY